MESSLDRTSGRLWGICYLHSPATSRSVAESTIQSPHPYRPSRSGIIESPKCITMSCTAAHMCTLYTIFCNAIVVPIVTPHHQKPTLATPPAITAAASHSLATLSRLGPWRRRGHSAPGVCRGPAYPRRSRRRCLPTGVSRSISIGATSCTPRHVSRSSLRCPLSLPGVSSYVPCRRKHTYPVRIPMSHIIPTISLILSPPHIILSHTYISHRCLELPPAHCPTTFLHAPDPTRPHPVPHYPRIPPSHSILDGRTFLRARVR